jgi:hypothetical protein
MCNLYSVRKPQKEIVTLVKAIRDLTGNLRNPARLKLWRWT